MNRVLDHNLRNKMNLLAGYADLLRSDLDDPDALKSVEVIAETTDDLMRIATAARRSTTRSRPLAGGDERQAARQDPQLAKPDARSVPAATITLSLPEDDSLDTTVVGLPTAIEEEWRTRSNTTTARTPPWTFASSDDRRVARGRDHRQRSAFPTTRPESSTAVRRR